MTDKIIMIPLDYSTNATISYMEVVENMKKGTPVIHTNCLDFFSFASLDKGYDVRVVKENGDYILLSELLKNDKTYTIREMRKAHNVHKMLLANSFTFKRKEA